MWKNTKKGNVQTSDQKIRIYSTGNTVMKRFIAYLMSYLLREIMRLRDLAIVCILVISAVSGCLSNTEKINDYGNETEATEYQGIKLTPLSRQRNNAVEGTQYIDKETYRLQIDGLVEKPVNLTYDQILAYPSTSKVVDMNCVEGWDFTAKWTGVLFETLLNDSGVRENATNVIFYCADKYSTSHDLDFLMDNDIMLAYRINDVTLPHSRGFPLQLVAEDKYGYKWAKWITRIEVTNAEYRGYWESRGYSDRADVGGPAFER
ncbi:MAG: molybdopterin-dependent oxidoreductase [Methanosarcinales archaeon]|nr:molybdopterin-dependent oxidoreductase [Methanosarcinales archaeon]